MYYIVRSFLFVDDSKTGIVGIYLAVNLSGGGVWGRNVKRNLFLFFFSKGRFPYSAQKLRRRQSIRIVRLLTYNTRFVRICIAYCYYRVFHRNRYNSCVFLFLFFCLLIFRIDSGRGATCDTVMSFDNHSVHTPTRKNVTRVAPVAGPFVWPTGPRSSNGTRQNRCFFFLYIHGHYVIIMYS